MVWYHGGMEKKLNAMQEAFVREYVVGGNATQAAIRAGYSAKTARAQGPALLKHPVVKAAIQEARSRTAAEGVATYDEVCIRMSQIIRQDDAFAAIKAADRLAKLRGWDQPKQLDINTTSPVFILPEGVDVAGTEFAQDGD